MMPSLAILRHDLRTLWSSWLVRLWLAGAAVLTLLLVSSNWAQFQTAPLISSLLVPFLVFPWFFVVIVLGVGPVSGSRAEGLADGILSRPVTRYEYLLASWAARVITVLGVFLLVLVPAIAMVALAAKRPVPPDTVTLYGIVASLGVVGLVLVFLVSLGFLLGTLLKRPLVAMVVLVFIWYPIGLVLDTFSLEEFSPISLNRAIPTLLRQPWSESDEPPKEEPPVSFGLEAMTEAVNDFGAFFSENPQPKAEPAPAPDFFHSKDYDDFSLIRVILGYGLPTLAAIALATLCFCRRDL